MTGHMGRISICMTVLLTLNLRGEDTMRAFRVADYGAVGNGETREFRVADYGAVGDGKTDDGPAIRRAVAAAVAAAPRTTVVFENRRYRLGRADVDYHIALKGVKGLTIEGNGAELINNPWNNIVKLEECEDVTVRGFVIDCDPLPFTQGTIKEVDTEAGAFLLKIHDGYDDPVEVYRRLGKANPDWGWGVCMDPEERKRKPEAIMHFHLKDVTSAQQGSDLLRVQLLDAYREHASELAVGDRFVITMKYGGHGASFNVSRSKDCRLEDNTIYTVKYGMTHALSDNRGRIHVKGVKITFRPGTDRLISTPKDGFHCKHNAVGPIIEDGLYEGMLDDAINISVCPYWVREDLGDNRYLIAELGFSPRKGDTLMAYRPSPGSITDGLVVQAVEPQPTPKGMRGKWNVVTLNKPIPGLGLHRGGDLFPGGREKLVFTGLYNIDASGKDYVVRNNVFLAQRRHALLARCSGGLFENNLVDGVGGHGVSLNNEVGSFYEGPLPRDTVIRNNTFRNTFWDAVKVYTNGEGSVARNITVTGNRIDGWYTDPQARRQAAAINLRNVVGGVVVDNIIGPGKVAPAISKPILIRKCRDIRTEEAPEKPGPTEYGTEPGDLVTPVMTDDAPGPGKRVRQVAPEYEGTEVYHTLYLPTNWVKGETYPVIVEYTGNKWQFGPGTIDVANLGYGMSGGEDYIWVTMPYVEKGRKENAVTWWGDRQATIDYCKLNLPRICKQWGGDPERVIVCGFSRGAIGTSYIGLADDEIAALWRGVFTFDHFDGHKSWGYPDSDRASALERLARLKGRPVLVGGQHPAKEDYLENHLDLADFTFLKVPTGTIFKIPGGAIQSTHTDMWLHRDSTYRRQVRAWMSTVLGTKEGDR